jgi:hypothetical protein
MIHVGGTDVDRNMKKDGSDCGGERFHRPRKMFVDSRSANESCRTNLKNYTLL